MQRKYKTLLAYLSLSVIFGSFLLCFSYPIQKNKGILKNEAIKNYESIYIEDSLLLNLNISNEKILLEIDGINKNNVSGRVLELIKSIEIQQLELREEIRKIAAENYFILPDTPRLRLDTTRALASLENVDLDGLKQKLIFQKSHLSMLPKTSNSKVLKTFSEKEIDFLNNIMDSLNHYNSN